MIAPLPFSFAISTLKSITLVCIYILVSLSPKSIEIFKLFCSQWFIADLTYISTSDSVFSTEVGLKRKKMSIYIYVYEEMHTNCYTSKNIVTFASNSQLYEHTGIVSTEKKALPIFDEEVE